MVPKPKFFGTAGGGWPYRLPAIGAGGSIAQWSRSFDFLAGRDVLCMLKQWIVLISVIQVVVFL